MDWQPLSETLLDGDRSALVTLVIPDPKVLEDIEGDLKHRLGTSGVFLNLEDLWAQPYSPVWPLVKQTSLLSTKSHLFAPLCGRLKPLFQAAEPTLPVLEEGLQEEVFYEQKSLQNLLITLLKELPGLGIRSLIIRNAQFLPAETVALLKRKDWTTAALKIFLIQEEEVPKGESWNATRDFWKSREVLAKSIRITDKKLRQKTRVPVADLERVTTLNQWLCFDHALALCDELKKLMVPGSEDYAQLLWNEALAWVGREEWNQGILLFEEYLEQPGARNPQEARIRQALCWRYSSGRETAVRLISSVAFQWDTFPPRLQLLTDLGLFFIAGRSGIAGVSPEILLERLERELEKAGWWNNLALILTQNVELSQSYHEKGLGEALARFRKGMKLAKSQSNRRRLTSALHSLGNLHMAAGHLDLVDLCFRRALKGYRKYAAPFHLARMLNAFGYHYFITGRYHKAFRFHQEALEILQATRHYEEIFITLFNLARLYLFTGQGPYSLKILETIFLLMNRLPEISLPYISPQTQIALMGLSALESGIVEQALELGRRLGLLDTTGFFREHTLIFFAQLAGVSGNPNARRRFEDADQFLKSQPTGLLPLQIRNLIQWGLYEDARQNREMAWALWSQALEICLGWKGFSLEKQRLHQLLSKEYEPVYRHLPLVPLGDRILKGLVESDARLVSLQTKIRQMSFLQKWQSLLNPGKPLEQLIQDVEALLKMDWGLPLVNVVGKDRPAPAWLTELRDWEFLLSLGQGRLLDQSLHPGLTSLLIFPLEGGLGYTHLCLGVQEGKIPLTPEDERVLALGVFSLNQDLGTRKKNQEIAQALDHLKTTQGHLVQAEKMAALGSLVAGVAHEINTPLGVAVTGNSILSEKITRLRGLYEKGEMKRSDLETALPELTETTQMIHQNLERAGRLIQSFKQIAVDQSSEQQRRFKIRDYLEEIATSLKPVFRGSPVVLQIAVEEDLVLDSFPGAFAQVITNLVMNSLQHGFDQGKTPGTILLEAKKIGKEYIEVSQKDNGKGIFPENIGRIFEPFFTTRRGQGGTGLGLHIVYNLVTHKLGGTIECESTPGVETVFRVRVPITQG